jgi:hypothetical protein
MDAPNNNIWGPQLWLFLHTITEKIGTVQLIRLPQEEHRLWIGLLSSLKLGLPCPLCKKHYTEYFNKHPIYHITVQEIRNWLYSLHSDVNTRLGKPNIVIEQLPSLYSNHVNLNNCMSILNEHMRRAIFRHWMTRDDMNRTLRFMSEIKGFYSL